MLAKVRSGVNYGVSAFHSVSNSAFPTWEVLICADVCAVEMKNPRATNPPGVQCKLAGVNMDHVCAHAAQRQVCVP